MRTLLGLIAAGLVLVSCGPAAEPPGTTTAPTARRKLENYVEQVPGGVDEKFEMVAIRGGRICLADPARPGVLREVVVKSFWIEKTETKWDEFNCFRLGKTLATDGERMREHGSTTSPDHPWSQPTGRPYADPTYGAGQDGTPVMSVTIFYAEQYCRWLSFHTGRKYRLPTEAEWEYACCCGAADPPARLTTEELNRIAWHRGNSNVGEGFTAHKVGEKAPSAWGLYDMLGNVAEWCYDLEGRPVLCGGSYLDPPEKVNCGARAYQTAGWNRTDPQNPKSSAWLVDAPFAGFRVVSDP